MLKSLLKGLTMGTGMGIGQELTGTILQSVLNKNRGDTGKETTAATPVERDIQCGGCGEINTGDSKFCGACGNCLVRKYNLASGIKCSCGFFNAHGQRFCSECGKPLS